MTFELSSDQQAVRDRALALAATLLNQAAAIDRSMTLAAGVGQQIADLVSDDALSNVLMVEAIAAASGAAALSVITTSPEASPLGLSGLKGAATIDDGLRAQVLLAAAAVGLGQAALDVALAELRHAAAHPGSHEEKPHWVVADAATELAAARLLTYKAAATSSDADTALARLMASSAAQHAIDAALRIAGPSGLQEGHVLERLARDIRAIGLVAGTEERQRAVAADALLPTM